ncbi:ATP-dependent Clp protease proteolytic subunit precursor [Candidatus Hodgkinia cicadicola]|nr:ATP-dependent Clp protease proteolytic subunit precursor [Candidatus Hodgkinia cicadicola]
MFNNTDFLANALLQSRIITITEEITAQVATIVCASLFFLESEDAINDITLIINSPGGEVYAGLSIYDTMQLIKPDVATVCIGTAASVASMLLAAGARGKRHCTLNSTIVIHQLTGGVNGQTSDLEVQTASILKLNDLTANIYAKHCKKPRAIITRAIEIGRFMTAEMALNWGLIDSIIYNANKL